jgi:hypothetical protein
LVVQIMIAIKKSLAGLQWTVSKVSLRFLRVLRGF